MSLELVVAIAPWLGEWMTVKIAEAVLGGVNTQLKQQDLDKALKTCVAKADDEVKLFCLLLRKVQHSKGRSPFSNLEKLIKTTGNTNFL
ncbi:hypothetical protein [Scytonema sp. PRP1]|uniref:hypothetical protein n=1 Tax=Scytonema sp. PRP1 TaxID=3120513 RepID=UPI002FCE7EEC